MPEAYMFFNMVRSLSVSFPILKSAHLKIFPESASYKAIDEDVRNLTKRPKVMARLEDPSTFELDVECTYLGFDTLPLSFRGRRESFHLYGGDIVSRGKAMGIPLDEGWWRNIQLLMRGHVLAGPASDTDITSV